MKGRSNLHPAVDGSLAGYSDGPVVHPVADEVEDPSPLQSILGRPVIIETNDGRADKSPLPAGAGIMGAVIPPRDQEKRLLPSRISVEGHEQQGCAGSGNKVSTGARNQERPFPPVTARLPLRSRYSSLISI